MLHHCHEFLGNFKQDLHEFIQERVAIKQEVTNNFGKGKKQFVKCKFEKIFTPFNLYSIRQLRVTKLSLTLENGQW
jgi:hypothetical protein